MFIIPGFRESITEGTYKNLKKFFESKNYLVKQVPISWDYKTMSDYIRQFEDFYAKNKSESNHVLGFSYGAVVAFSSAEKLGIKKLYLCSLSPDFVEDVAGMQDWIKKYIGIRRLEDCLTRSGREIAKKLNIPTIIFYGEKEAAEFPQILTRTLETKKLAKNVRVVEVKEAPHDISHPAYRKAIEEVF